MFPKKRATRATKHINPLPSTGFMRSTLFFCLLHCLLQKTLDVLLGTGFMRSTKRATFLGLLYFQMLIISIITFSMYAISRTIQNISFNTPYDLTTRIKSLICKITRFYMKIFVTSSYGTLNGISMIFPCITKNNLCPFSGRKFFAF